MLEAGAQRVHTLRTSSHVTPEIVHHPCLETNQRLDIGLKLGQTIGGDFFEYAHVGLKW